MSTNEDAGCTGPSEMPGKKCGRKKVAGDHCDVHYRQSRSGSRNPKKGQRRYGELRPIRARSAAVPGGRIRRYGLMWKDPESLMKFEAYVSDLNDARALKGEPKRSVLEILSEHIEGWVESLPG